MANYLFCSSNKKKRSQSLDLEKKLIFNSVSTIMSNKNNYIERIRFNMSHIYSNSKNKHKNFKLVFCCCNINLVFRREVKK